MAQSCNYFSLISAEKEGAVIKSELLSQSAGMFFIPAESVQLLPFSIKHVLKELMEQL